MKLVLLEECCEILDAKRIPITAKDRKKGPYPYYGANGVQDYVADYIFDDELVLLAEDGGNFGSEERPIAYRVSGKCWVNNHAHVLKPKAGMNVDYLCYSLMFYKVDGMVNGATRMKLTQAAMRKMMIPARKIEEQKAIVGILDKVHTLIAAEKEQLKKYDELLKSRFVEMFGDLNKNSKNYPVKGLSEISSYWNGLTYKPSDTAEEGEGTLVLRSSNIQNGVLVFDDNVYVKCKIKEKLLVRDNDILMCTRNGSAALVGKTALIKGLTKPTTFGAFMMIIRSEYYSYLKTYFETPFFRNQISTGTTTINQITGKMLNEVQIPVPDIHTVHQFEIFVHQNSKLKSTVEKSIEKLEMLKKSFMQQYFGRNAGT